MSSIFCVSPRVITPIHQGSLALEKDFFRTGQGLVLAPCPPSDPGNDDNQENPNDEAND